MSLAELFFAGLLANMRPPRPISRFLFQLDDDQLNDLVRQWKQVAPEVREEVKKWNLGLIGEGPNSPKSRAWRDEMRKRMRQEYENGATVNDLRPLKDATSHGLYEMCKACYDYKEALFEEIAECLKSQEF